MKVNCSKWVKSGNRSEQLICGLGKTVAWLISDLEQCVSVDYLLSGEMKGLKVSEPNSSLSNCRYLQGKPLLFDYMLIARPEASGFLMNVLAN